jgi:nicotinate-nucleotide adenylyltransferase
MSNKRVGIYSGVFDPVHQGHLGLAQAALDLGLVDKVYLMVEAEPRRKTEHSDYRHRLNMAWLATHEHPKMELLVLDDHPQFSIRETLPALEEKFGPAPISLIMGSDLAKFLHTWPDYDMLKGRVRLIIGERDGSPLTRLPQDHIIIKTKNPGLSATDVRRTTSANRKGSVTRTVGQYIDTNKLYEA